MSKKPLKLDGYFITFIMFFVGMILLFSIMGVRFINSPNSIRYPTLAILFGGMAIPLLLRSFKK